MTIALALILAFASGVLCGVAALALARQGD